MRTVQVLSVALVALFVAACGGGGDETQTETDFFKGGAVDPGQQQEYPVFEAQPYAEGPYGSQIGSVVANIQFLGWKDPMASNMDVEKLETVSLADMYDPDGTKGIKLIYVNGFAKWCPPCKAEFAYMNANGTYATYRAKGMEFLAAMIEDANLSAPSGPGPAKPIDIRDWADAYDVGFPLVIDPNRSLGSFFAADAFPSAFLIDARTMRVTDKVVGGDMEALLALFDKRLAEMQ